jgi:hypothetical protein
MKCSEKGKRARSARRADAGRSLTRASDAHGAVWSTTAAATARKQIGKCTSRSAMMRWKRRQHRTHEAISRAIRGLQRNVEAQVPGRAGVPTMTKMTKSVRSASTCFVDPLSPCSEQLSHRCCRVCVEKMRARAAGVSNCVGHPCRMLTSCSIKQRSFFSGLGVQSAKQRLVCKAVLHDASNTGSGPASCSHEVERGT